MNSKRQQMYPCKKCGATYKTECWLQKHLNDKHAEPLQTRKTADLPLKKPVIVRDANKKAYIKQKISPILRFKVWETFIGSKIEGVCFCCNTNKITPFTSHHTFQAGHIVSEKMGGKCSIDNLLPICRDCNRTMGIQHWDDFVKYNGFPVRIYGSDIPASTQNYARQIQKAWRYAKKNKPKAINKKSGRKKRKKIPNYMKPTKSFMNYMKLRSRRAGGSKYPRSF